MSNYNGSGFTHFDELGGRRRRGIYNHVADAFSGNIRESLGWGGNGFSRPEIAFAPIDHSGGNAWDRAKGYLKYHLRYRGIGVLEPKQSLEQATEVWENEHRKVTGSPDTIFDRRRLGDVAALVMLDNSVSGGQNGSGVIGPSTMGGIVWAIKNLKYFGNDGEGVKIFAYVERDYGPQRIANVSCHYRNGSWLGCKRQLNDDIMPRTLDVIGSNPSELRAIEAISDQNISYNPQDHFVEAEGAVLQSTGLGLLGDLWDWLDGEFAYTQ